jgi:hypothetical protein
MSTFQEAKDARAERMTPKLFLMHMLTCKDGASVDIARVLWLAITLAHIGYTAWQAGKTAVFDPTAFATAQAALAIAFGAAIGVKAHAEPGK